MRQIISTKRIRKPREWRQLEQDPARRKRILADVAAFRSIHPDNTLLRGRLKAVESALSKGFPIARIAEFSDVRRARCTVYRQVHMALKDGVAQLCSMGPQYGTKITPTIAEHLKSELKQHRLQTGRKIIEWLRTEHGVAITRGGLSSWLYRHRIRLRLRGHLKGRR